MPRIVRPPTATAESAPYQTERRRILIVDDNADAADSLSMLLASRGHQTQVAYSGKDALTCVESFKPDVALLDIGLPEMTGYELAQQLRATAQLEGICLVALTGYGQTEDQQRSRAAGFDDHLVKPVDLQALERTLAGISARGWAEGGESGGKMV